MTMLFEVAGDGDSLVSEIDGYLCFMRPVNMAGSLVVWRWLVQSGGGWTHRGGVEVNTHAEGEEIGAAAATAAIEDWINNYGD